MEWWGFVEGFSVALVVVGAVSVLVAIGLARMSGQAAEATEPARHAAGDRDGHDDASRDTLGRAMARARDTGRPMAIVWIDLEEARRASDALAPDARVALLETLARRLRDCVRAGDRVVRQHGGDGRGSSPSGSDEIVLLVGDLTARQDAAGVARRLLEELARPMMIGGQPVSIAASAGIAVYPGDGDDADTLLVHAEQALRHARAQERGSCAFYCDAASAEVPDGFTLRTELDRAIDRHEARLFGEPRAGGHPRAIVGVDVPARS